MNELVQACRREWKRLRVPAEVAEEMAAELAADLEDAAADGLGPADVLGAAAADPAAFARAWAGERGVVGTRKRRAALAAMVVLVALVAVAVAVAVLGVDHTQPAVRVPNVVGLSKRAAIVRAEAAGLSVRVVRGRLPSDKGRMITIAPANGLITLSEGSATTLTFTATGGSLVVTDVVAQLPAAGTPVRRGDELHLVLAPLP